MKKNPFELISDRDFVACLLQNDPAAWNYLLVELVTPMTRYSKYARICAKYNIPPDSLVTRVWLLLRKNDFRKLRLFRFDSAFTTYLFIIIREAQRYEIKETLGKIPCELSENDCLCTQIVSKTRSDSVELTDEMNYANKLLSVLWDDNPQQAWVLLMRNSLKLSSKEVALFLNKSSENVDQMNSRAKIKMKQLKKMNERKK